MRAVGWPWQRFRVPRAGPNMAAGSWGLRPFLGGSGKNVAMGQWGLGVLKHPAAAWGEAVLVWTAVEGEQSILTPHRQPRERQSLKTVEFQG